MLTGKKRGILRAGVFGAGVVLSIYRNQELFYFCVCVSLSLDLNPTPGKVAIIKAIVAS